MPTTNRDREALAEQGLPGLIKTAEVVLDAVSEAIALVFRMPVHRRMSFEATRELSRLLFTRLNVQRMRSTGLNEHIARGLFGYGQERLANRLKRRPADYTRPRLADLVLMHCQAAADQTDESNKAFVLIPSPIYVAIDALTIPEDVQTRAYALLAYRLILSKRFGVWPAVSFSPIANGAAEGGDGLLSESDIVDEIRSIRTFLEHRDNRSTTKSNVKQFVSHFIAAKGIFFLRLKPKLVGEFLRSQPFASRRKDVRRSRIVPEFRLSKRYRELPEASTFINEILGVPIAIRGTDTVFFNGIKPSADRNLVMDVSGGPGTGKTSLSLAIAAALAPFDTHTLYLSFEEDEDDLKVKLKTQSQPRLRRLSFNHRNDFSWFSAVRLPDLDVANFENDVLADLKSRLGKMRAARSKAFLEKRLVPPLPLMVVIDSISSLRLNRDVRRSTSGETSFADDTTRERSAGTFSDSAYPTGGDPDLRQRLIRFIEKCRDLGAFVILVSAARSEVSEALDYLVDIALTLRIKDGEDHQSKPLRLLTLSKSRHQMARHGTHVFHLSGESGFRLAPQLPSQSDAQQSLQHLLWDPNTSREVLNVRRVNGSRRYEWVEILSLPIRSQVLIHGKGSTGKAGLALKFALAPRFTNGRYDNSRPPARVLIVSFLYPESYYEELRKRITGRILREQGALAKLGFDKGTATVFVASMPRLGFVQLAPGFLSAEDLYSKIMRALEGARLEGRPYTDVIIDGLHNLALQFPGARDTDVLWPIVYGTLSRVDVSTFTTFTTLGLKDHHDEGIGSQPEEALFRLRTHLPLMHALVQASDYVFEVERPPKSDFCNVHVRSAINREPPWDALRWNRNELEFVTPRVPTAPRMRGETRA
jgi:hypothetical protein